MAVRGDDVPADHVGPVAKPGTQSHHGFVTALPVPCATVVHPPTGGGDDGYRAGVHRDGLAEGQHDPRRRDLPGRTPHRIAAFEHGMRGRRSSRYDHGHEHGREQEADAPRGVSPATHGVNPRRHSVNPEPNHRPSVHLAARGRRQHRAPCLATASLDLPGSPESSARLRFPRPPSTRFPRPPSTRFPRPPDVKDHDCALFGRLESAPMKTPRP